ncbi:GlmU family protein [Limibacter armeniacum]|uniref:GlmU family protein n=1 Tax=Limibacter armeniacum TaxID=466084 RepID=UPI002FE5D00E
MNVILFDDPENRVNLLPFTFVRPVSALRVGIMTLAEKWEKALGTDVSYLTQDYLQEKFPLQAGSDNLYINASVCPNSELVDRIHKLKEGQCLMWKDELLAVRTMEHFRDPSEVSATKYVQKDIVITPVIIRYPWDIFINTRNQIIADFPVVTEGRKSAPIEDRFTVVYGEENIFVEEGASIRAAILNAEKGPIYIGKGAEIHEGSVIRGACSIGEGTKINMSAKVHEDCSFGPYCKVGGEVSNSVFQGYSNKGHDGFLGNSVLAEWCNLGADTNTSNLKNNYGEVKVWNYKTRNLIETGQMFCGLMMGDHSKAGINTMFNTGTVVGVSANIFGGGFPDKHIPSFAWGGIEDTVTADFDKMCEVATAVMGRRHVDFTEVDRQILKRVFEITALDRN